MLGFVREGRGVRVMRGHCWGMAGVAFLLLMTGESKGGKMRGETGESEE